MNVSRAGGFTLIEVLIALALAALGFGVVLHSIGLQMSLVATAVDRHQMLMHASQVLESSLSRGVQGDEEVEQGIPDFTRANEVSTEKPAVYFYSLDAKPVTADPRVQQVSVTIKGRRGSQVRLSAYRLRVRRDSEPEAESNPESTAPPESGTQ